MKNTIILILSIIFAFYAFGKLNQYCSDKIYESCLEGNHLSKEQCYHYAYEQ